MGYNNALPCIPLSLFLFFIMPPCCHSYNAFEFALPALPPCSGVPQLPRVERGIQGVHPARDASLCAACYQFLSPLIPKWDVITFVRCFISPVTPLHQEHKMTCLRRQSEYHHSKIHKSILGPGSVHTCNIGAVALGSIRCSVPCVSLSPLRSPCSRAW